MIGLDHFIKSFTGVSTLLNCRPKGDNVDVKAIGEDSAGVQQCFVVFDVLMINDTNLANQPLRERVDQLKKCVRYHCHLL